ncbi:MAG: hypothetical protein GY757_29530, partial [bacterium]|nr:hypothetical protein [bacterium]
RRHESLRTSFHMLPVSNNQLSPVQIIHDTLEFKIENISPNQTFFRPFDLTRAPLIRVGVIESTGKVKSGVERFVLVDMHHIITDGLSQEILTKEFFALYAGGSLPPLKLQYRDYAEWQSSSEQKQLIKKQEEYWEETFSGELPVLDLPTDYPRPALHSFEGNALQFTLEKQEIDTLKKIASNNNITLYMAILSLFTLLLSKLGGGEDIILGSPTAGRRHADLENIIGMFV